MRTREEILKELEGASDVVKDFYANKYIMEVLLDIRELLKENKK